MKHIATEIFGESIVQYYNLIWIRICFYF